MARRTGQDDIESALIDAVVLRAGYLPVRAKAVAFFRKDSRLAGGTTTEEATVSHLDALIAEIDGRGCICLGQPAFGKSSGIAWTSGRTHARGQNQRRPRSGRLRASFAMRASTSLLGHRFENTVATVEDRASIRLRGRVRDLQLLPDAARRTRYQTGPHDLSLPEGCRQVTLSPMRMPERYYSRSPRSFGVREHELDHAVWRYESERASQ